MQEWKLSMNNQINHKPGMNTAKIVAIYALFGLAWIYGSDSLLGWLVSDPGIMVKIAVIKGSLFIFCTATLLYWLISLYSRQLATAERLQTASLEEYRLIFNATNEAIFVHDSATGRILDLNDRMVEMFGYTREESMAADIGQLSEGVYPYTQEEAIKKVAKAVHDGPQVFEWVCRKKTGELFWCEVSLKSARNNGFDRIIAVVRDISERKLGEQALKESNSKIRSLVDNVPGFIAFLNAESLQYEFVNKEYEKSFGKSADEIVGSHISEVIGESNYRFADKFIEMARSGKSVSYENVFEIDSRKRWINVNYRPIADDCGHVRSIVVHSYDITDLKEHEEEQLKVEKLESLGVLAGGIAHDFNNLLTGIMGNISLAQMHIDPAHKSCIPLQGAVQASVRAAELARQLLTFARGGEPCKKLVSLRPLLIESVSLLLRGSNVRPVVEISDDIHSVNADEGQLVQVFHNIIINATQAMPDGGRLTVGACNVDIDGDNLISLPVGQYVRIAFSDEGCGIPEGILKKIFDPYYTTKSSGNGLGLASANSIISRHGGHISVDSVVGKGTKFTIHLPSIGLTGFESRPKFEAPAAKIQSSGSVLVMDDEEMIRDLTNVMLAELGYQVTNCSDGKVAFDLYKSAREAGTPYSAVIMDLTVPGGMGGKEAAEMILAFDADAHLIVSSGYSNDPIMSDFSNYGFRGAVAKPYSVTELAKILSSVH